MKINYSFWIAKEIKYRKLKLFVQLRPARFYDANEGRLDSTIPMLHNHVNLSLAAKECFHSDYQSTLRFDKNLFQNVVWFDNLTDSANQIVEYCQIIELEPVFEKIFVDSHGILVL